MAFKFSIVAKASIEDERKHDDERFDRNDTDHHHHHRAACSRQSVAGRVFTIGLAENLLNFNTCHATATINEFLNDSRSHLCSSKPSSSLRNHCTKLARSYYRSLLSALAGTTLILMLILKPIPTTLFGPIFGRLSRWSSECGQLYQSGTIIQFWTSCECDKDAAKQADDVIQLAC